MIDADRNAAKPTCRTRSHGALALLAAVLSVATAATLRGSDHAPPPVSLERPGYGAIPLRAPSQSLGDASSSGSAPRRGERADDAAGTASGATTGRSAALPLITIGSSLAVVLGLFAALVWVSKKTGSTTARGGALPDEALRLLGQKSLGASGSIALIRCGRSVLVVGISPAGMQRLAEINDAEQVRDLEAICRGESAADFQAALGEMPFEPTDRSFTGEPLANPHARKKLFSDG